MATGVPRVRGSSPLGEAANRRLALAGRRRLIGRWRLLPAAVFFGCTALWAAAAAVMIQYGAKPEVFGASWAGYAVVTVAGAALAQRRVVRVALARWRARGLPAAQTLDYELADEGLRITSDASNTCVLWPHVSEVAPAGQYWLLLAGGLSYFLPRRFFETPQAEIDFLAALLARMTPAARERSVEARKLTMFI